MKQINHITIDIPPMSLAKAEEARRTIQKYADHIFLQIQYNIPEEENHATCAEQAPHEITLAALNEARSGKYAGVVDTSSEEAFLKSLGL